MRNFGLTEKAAIGSLALTSVPLIFQAAWLAAPKPSWLAADIAQSGVVALSYWWWVWGPTYLLAKGLFLWHAYKRDRETTRRAAKWMVGINLALILQLILVTMVQP